MKIIGNASDIALLRFCECFVPTDRVRREFPLVFQIPFSSIVKWQLTITKDLTQNPGNKGNSKYIVMVKGAPEKVLLLCNTWQDRNGSIKNIDENFRQLFNEAYERFGNQGKRVIGYCETYFEAASDLKFSAEEPANFPM